MRVDAKPDRVFLALDKYFRRGLSGFFCLFNNLSSTFTIYDSDWKYMSVCLFSGKIVSAVSLRSVRVSLICCTYEGRSISP